MSEDRPRAATRNPEWYRERGRKWSPGTAFPAKGIEPVGPRGIEPVDGAPSNRSILCVAYLHKIDQSAIDPGFLAAAAKTGEGPVAGALALAGR